MQGSPGDGTPAETPPESGPISDRPDIATDPGRGRRIGIDVGTVRIGVASCDPDGILATPVETVPRAGKGKGGAGKGRAGGKGAAATDLARIVDIVREYEAVEVVVGLPRTLRGENGASATLATRFAKSLRSLLPDVPIRLSDERLTTVAAARALRDSGVRARGQRQMIDQAAAVSILQGWLDERSAVLRSAGDAGGGVSE
ncbi:Holliday junction resolvase RuvX [Nocardia macrotermitis]|uniref:Putative pre-16S rRNA nuclease n=1 Tax=Nocardia macrotermitis TaxID=2585198 RepID=A0A7K0D8S1_9NOCA|nr:Holliday junction resolvase RuvX [Nocardia macrotermitis]MQY21941.1 putative pre-16S rRNA nuclease [Nocardia macrotermitis]